MALSMSGCTLVGVGAGGLYAANQNGDPQVAQGEKPRTSVGKSMAVGGAIGLVVDIGLVALSLSSGQLGH